VTSVPGPVGGIVLTGGDAVRLDGADKAGVEVGGKSLLEHALEALAGLAEVVVVGPEVATTRPVTFRREDPPGGGPAAAVLAGLAGFGRRPRLVVVLAVDMPLVTSGTVERLLAAVTGDGAILVDPPGRRQYLCAAYSVDALERERPPDEHGLPMRRLVGDLGLVEVPATGREAEDVDTWADLRRLREAEGR
jgi:molybdopterin-guanine dinucleotide biosynthesis protein A